MLEVLAEEEEDFEIVVEVGWCEHMGCRDWVGRGKVPLVLGHHTESKNNGK